MAPSFLLCLLFWGKGRRQDLLDKLLNSGHNSIGSFLLHAAATILESHFQGWLRALWERGERGVERGAEGENLESVCSRPELAKRGRELEHR